MKITHFLRLSWLLQLFVGLGLFVTSFLIESHVLQAFFDMTALAILIAVTLELAKISAIIWHRYLSFYSSTSYPAVIRYTSTVFRFGLVLLSILCSLFFLGENLGQQNLSKIQEKEINQVKLQNNIKIEKLEKDRDYQLSQQQIKQDKAHEKLRKRYTENISNLEYDLTKEMDNVVAGVFIGKRYKTIQQRLESEKIGLASALEALSNRHREETHKLYVQFNQLIAAENIHFQASLKNLSEKNYVNDHRVNNEYIAAFLNMINSVFNQEIHPLQLVFFFSVMMSVLIEIGIVLAFETVTVSVMPILAAQAEAVVNGEVVKAQVVGKMEEDDIRHEASIYKVKKSADRIVDEIRSTVGSSLSNNGENDSRKLAS